MPETGDRVCVVEAKSRRYRELDALRGLGACTVASSHFLLSFLSAPPEWHESRFRTIEYWIGVIVFGGHSALPLFFMLSGFVLALPACNGRPQSYSVFLTRRTFRLYAPYVVGLAIAVLGNKIWYGPLHLNSWVNLTWSRRVSWHLVLQHLLIFGQFNWAGFNTAFWTLVVSLRISVIFPLLCYFVLRTKPVVSILSIVSIGTVLTWIQIHGGLNTYTSTLHVMGFYIAGILFARYRSVLLGWAAALSTRKKAIYFTLALLVYWYGQRIAELIWKNTTKTPVYGMELDWITALGSILLMALSIEFEPVSKFLLSSFPQFMGKICYSVYLVHGTVLWILLFTLSGKISPVLLYLMYFPIVLGVSTIFHYAVEKPSMEFGREVTRSKSTSPAAVFAPANAS